MPTQRLKRTNILLPEDLARDIDEVAGPRGRTAFLVETAREAVRKRKLLAFLNDTSIAWKNKDHPELKDGSAAWVKRLRRENERRSKAKLRKKS